MSDQAHLTTKKRLHQWDREGEHCLVCGAADWMDDPVCPGRRHIESADCWCNPTLDTVTEDGSKVWVHHEPN